MQLFLTVWFGWQVYPGRLEFTRRQKPYQRESRTCLDDRTPGPVVGPQLSLSHPILLIPFIGSDHHPLLERCLPGPWLTRSTPSRGLQKRSPKSLRAHPGIIKEVRLTSSLCHYWKVGTMMESQSGIPNHHFSLQWECNRDYRATVSSYTLEASIRSDRVPHKGFSMQIIWNDPFESSIFRACTGGLIKRSVLE